MKTVLVVSLSCLGGFFILGTAKAAPPEIVSRAAWKAKPAIITLMTEQVPHSIVIHHTSVRQQPLVSLEKKMQNLQSFSLRSGTVGNAPKPPWGDVPYHFYVDAAGRIAEGRDTKYAGDSNTRYTVGGRIQVVVEGDFEREQPSDSQLVALQQLLNWLSGKHKIAPAKITGHNDHATTDCPGKNLKRHIDSLRLGAILGGSAGVK